MKRAFLIVAIGSLVKITFRSWRDHFHLGRTIIGVKQESFCEGSFVDLSWGLDLRLLFFRFDFKFQMRNNLGFYFIFYKNQ